MFCSMMQVVTSLFCSADGKQLSTLQYNGTLCVWDLQSGRCVSEMLLQGFDDKLYYG